MMRFIDAIHDYCITPLVKGVEGIWSLMKRHYPIVFVLYIVILVLAAIAD